MINKLKLICIVFILSIYLCQTIIGLEYREDADFSDIFKGYEKTDCEPKLTDPLSNDLHEISELVRLNQMTFDQIRKFNICEKDEGYISIPNSGQMIASAFLNKVCFLFYYNVKGGDEFFIFNSLGKFFKRTNVDEKNKFLRDEGIVPSYSLSNISEAEGGNTREWISVVGTACYENKRISDEQKYFLLSIRQAILKIASNPVGRRLFCRILNKINDKKILIVQTRFNSTKGSFSFNEQLTNALDRDYICVTVPWKLGKSEENHPGAGAVRTKTDKQLSVRVDAAISDDMQIIGRSSEKKDDGSDEKPFYISLCHEFIHCLHYLEGTIVHLNECDANKMMFSEIYKKCFWDKNVDLIFQNISFYYLFNYNGTEEFTIDNYEEMCKCLKERLASRPAQTNDAYKKLKLSIIVDNLLSWSGLGPSKYLRIRKVLFSELYENVANDRIDTFLLKYVFQSIIEHKASWFITQQERYGTQWNGDEKSINYELIRSILKGMALTYFLSKLRIDCFFKDYPNGEEIYVVTGLRYNKDIRMFVIDNVSELSFNALEENNVVRVSYSPDCLLSITDEVLSRIEGKLSQLVMGGQARISMQQLLKLLTGNVRFDRLAEGEKLEEQLCSKLGIKESVDIFDGIM